jgi:hypothetical protein
LEAHAELAKLGEHRVSMVTRTEGFAFYDGSSTFFDDPLIDLPELYIQDDFQIKGMDSKLVFGKFANRRFFSKNEINSDPFDIGERAFFSALANYNNVLASIQTARDPDQLNSIQASGSYGFLWSIKENDANKLQWGYKQSLLAARLEDFGDNFYGISEINVNWGDKKPGQLDIGLAYAQDQVFRIANPSKDLAYLFYSSITQRFSEQLSSYLRYSLLSGGGQDHSTNNIVAGAYYNISDKDSISSHVVWTESSTVPDSISHLNAWVHKFNPQLYCTVFNTYRYNIAAATADGGDSNWFIGLNLTAVF